MNETKQEVDVDSFLKRATPKGKNSQLIPYVQTIQDLRAKHYTLDQVRTFLASNGIEITISGISTFLKRLDKRQLKRPPSNPNRLNVLHSLIVEGAGVDRVFAVVKAELEEIRARQAASIQDLLINTIRIAVEERLEQTELEAGAMESITSQLETLIEDLGAMFDLRCHILDNFRHQYGPYFETSAIGSAATPERAPGVTVEEFFYTEVPDELPVNTLGLLAPFNEDVERLREAGFGWRQVSQFLRRNGVLAEAGPLERYYASRDHRSAKL